MTLLKNARVYTPDGMLDWLRWDGTTISAMGTGTPPPVDSEDVIDARGQTLLPGFIDLHIHGAAGHDVMDATPEALRGMSEFCARHGVTGFLPTTLTHTRQHTRAALENIKAYAGATFNGAAILGAHLEGPFLNVERCGAQNPQYIRLPEADEIDFLFGLDIIRLFDLAPEFPENRALIQACRARGMTVSVAHSSATAAQLVEAHGLGLTHCTHTYNAQTGLHHREPGIVGAALTTPGIRCELIADGIHVHPLAMKILWACKGRDGVMLITDAIRAAGMPEGDYGFDERTIIVRGGSARLPDGTLAGSVLTMDRALYNFMQATGAPLEDLWPSSSWNAARALGIDNRKGALRVGMDADLVLLDEALRPLLTVVEGRVVYRAGAAAS